MSRPDIRNSRAHRRGVALTELMIGLAIGLMVIAAALSASASLLRAAALARDSADLQQRADMGLRLIGRQLRQAGSVRLLHGIGGYRFSQAFGGWSETGTAVSGIEGGPGKPDLLRVSYEPESEEDRDALGYLANKDGAGMDEKAGELSLDHFDSQFFIEADETASDRDALYARGARLRPRQSLVVGVDDLQLQYGIQAADGSFAYVDVDKLPPGASVAAVAVCLQVSSDARHGTAGGLDCQGAVIPATRHKGRLVRLARTVFRINNAG